MSARFLGASLIFVFLLSLLPAVAMAHSRFAGSEPAADETVPTAPETIRLRFSNPVEADFSRIEVRDSTGNRVDNDDVARASDDPNVVEVGLAELEPGEYHVDWNVVSGDGHRVKGKFSFTVE